MIYDLIIVACSSKKKLIDITQRCIDSARVDIPNLHVIVVETFGLGHNYKNCEIVRYTGQFNYNRALNQGIKRAKGDVFILANNDVFFHPGWSVIGDLMVSNGFGSASALSGGHRMGFEDSIYEGYAIGTLLTGWCIFALRETIEKIGGLDETFDFWHSDNVYADQLRTHGIRHGLFCNIQVDHLESTTLKTLPSRVQRRYSFDSIRKYKELKGV